MLKHPKESVRARQTGGIAELQSKAMNKCQVGLGRLAQSRALLLRAAMTKDPVAGKLTQGRHRNFSEGCHDKESSDSQVWQKRLCF